MDFSVVFCVFRMLGICWASFIFCLLFLQISVPPSLIWPWETVYSCIRLFKVPQLTAPLFSFFFSFFCYVLEFTNLLFAEYMLLLFHQVYLFFYLKHCIFYFFQLFILGLSVFSLSTLWTSGIQLNNYSNVLVSRL